ncbi:HEAT repeat domain-containing protein [Natronorubrum sp. FCH18a]|uniref:HEAT repeat domain-containing protein n=1 Tax=Natronorubrum sp. FCH18a TaxID=3447018 RepID=UPI003F50EF44
MDDSTQPSPAGRLDALLEDDRSEEAVACLERLTAADTETRKTALRALREGAETKPDALEPVLTALTPFLTDEERSIRLTTAKLFATVAQAEPEAASSVVPALAARLADEDEFYYVRARSAEALGYVALEVPDTVASPEVLADLRIGLSFDEPEVREKLAKALEYLALADQSRLRHHVSDLTRNLGDSNELVRYHLCTALAAIGCAYPDAVSESTAALADRLDDESAFVRGRAVETFGLLARADSDVSVPDVTQAVESGASSDADDDAERFLRDRIRFATNASGEEPIDTDSVGIGMLEGIRDRTDEVVDAITSPDGDECPHCGQSLPAVGPPICPRCGDPR